MRRLYYLVGGSVVQRVVGENPRVVVQNQKKSQKSQKGQKGQKGPREPEEVKHGDERNTAK